MQKIWAIFGFVVLFIVAGVSIQAEGEPPLVKLGTVLAPAHPTCQSLPYFYQRLQELGDAPLNLRIFPDGQLGTSHEVLYGLQFGNIELGILSSDTLVSAIPLLSAVSMPYLWRNDEHRFQVLDGPVGQKLLDAFTKHNLVGLGFLDSGMQNLIGRQQQIALPEDLQGLKIGRLAMCTDGDCQDSLLPLIKQMFAVSGATVEPIGREALYGAIESEEIVLLEGSVPEVLHLNLSEMGTQHIIYSRHTAIPDVLVVSRPWFESLSPTMQQAIQKAARLTVQHQRRLWESFMQNAVTQLESAGMTFETIDRDPFYDAVQPVYVRMYEELGPEFEEIIQAIQAVK